MPAMFPPTRLSVVERLASDDPTARSLAWEAVVAAYWRPVYKYLRVKWTLDADDAADLTQEFFASALEREVVEKYDPSRARFRTYLRLCLDGFASNARKAERRLKRGGGITMVPLDFETAEGEMATHTPVVEADIDDPPDGQTDFRVTILDDLDEFPVANAARDNNLKILVKSRCIKYPESSSSVVQLVELTQGRQQYEQEGRGQDKVGFAGGR